MNRNISIIIAAITCLLWACEDQLEKFPLSEIAPENFFRNREDLNLYANSFYSYVPSGEDIYGGNVDNIIRNALSDAVRGVRTVPTSGGGWTWEQLRKINFFLENSHKCEDENARKEYEGIARFFRAWFYFDKVKRFGDVPWYSGTISTDDEENLVKARDPRTLVMDSVLADLDFAIANMPTSKSTETVTKWTALAMKSRVGLYEGTFRKYHTEFSIPDANKFLDAAIVAAEELINSGIYSLYQSSPDKAYLELFASYDAIGQEVILARKYSDELQVYHEVNFDLIASTQGRRGLEKKFVNSYLMSDGSRFTDNPDYNTILFSEETQNRDLRLSQTIRTPGYTRIDQDVPLVPDFGATVTGYHIIKYLTETTWDIAGRAINDIPVFRYAEVLLNYAEAKAERGNITQSDIDRSIKLLRDRVAMPNLDLAYSNANPDQYLADNYIHVDGTNKGIILEIRRERGIELVMEDFRWDDLMRWKEGHLIAEQFKGTYFPGVGDYDLDNDGIVDVVVYTGDKPTEKGPQYLKIGSDVILENGENGGLILVNSHITKTFDENKDYFFPIPIEERLLNHNLTQNPGWDDGLDF